MKSFSETEIFCQRIKFATSSTFPISELGNWWFQGLSQKWSQLQLTAVSNHEGVKHPVKHLDASSYIMSEKRRRKTHENSAFNWFCNFKLERKERYSITLWILLYSAAISSRRQSLRIQADDFPSCDAVLYALILWTICLLADHTCSLVPYKIFLLIHFLPSIFLLWSAGTCANIHASFFNIAVLHWKQTR